MVGTYNGQSYNRVNAFGTACGSCGGEDLVTLGWERAGVLITLFPPPWGPKVPLVEPQSLFSSDPSRSNKDDSASARSQRPYRTLTAFAAARCTGGTSLEIDTSFSKKHYDTVVKAVLDCDAALLIARPGGSGPIAGFSNFTQLLLAGNCPVPPVQ